MKNFYKRLLLEELELGNLNIDSNNNVCYGGEKIKYIVSERPSELYSLGGYFRKEILYNETEADYSEYRENTINEFKETLNGLRLFLHDTVDPTYSVIVEGSIEEVANYFLAMLPAFDILIFKRFIETKIEIAQSAIEDLELGVNRSNSIKLKDSRPLSINRRGRLTIDLSKKECVILFFILQQIKLFQFEDRARFQEFLEANINYMKKSEAVPFTSADVEVSRLIKEIIETPDNIPGGPNHQKNELVEEIIPKLINTLMELAPRTGENFNKVRDVWGGKYTKSRHFNETEK